jgi:hypothetical protein
MRAPIVPNLTNSSKPRQPAKLRMDMLKCQGSSTLEFILCAPALLILMYVAMEMNERIEQRVTATIAAGNSSWLADPNTSGPSSPAAAEMAKADILGTKSASNPVLLSADTVVDATLTNSSVMAYSPEKMKQNAYDINITRTVSSVSNDNAKNRSSQTVGNISSDATATNINNIVNQASRIADGIQNHHIPWIPQLFPEATPVEQQVLSWSAKDAGATNAGIKAITDLAGMISSNAGSDLTTFNSPTAKVLAAKSTYLRRDPMYHPNKYENQALYGMLFGAVDTEYTDFNDKCFMNLERTPCGQHNGFVDYLETAHSTIVTLRTAIQCTCKVPYCVDMIAAILLGIGIDVAENALTKAVMDPIIADVTSTIDGALQGPHAEIQRQIDSVQNGATSTISNELNTLLDSAEVL